VNFFQKFFSEIFSEFFFRNFFRFFFSEIFSRIFFQNLFQKFFPEFFFRNFFQNFFHILYFLKMVVGLLQSQLGVGQSWKAINLQYRTRTNLEEYSVSRFYQEIFDLFDLYLRFLRFFFQCGILKILMLLLLHYK